MIEINKNNIGKELERWFSKSILIYEGVDFNDYALSVVDELKKNGIRVDFDFSAETTGKKVRNAQIEKIPLVLNVGEKEKKAGTVAVRTNIDGKLKFGVKVSSLIKAISENVASKEIEFKI